MNAKLVQVKRTAVITLVRLTLSGSLLHRIAMHAKTRRILNHPDTIMCGEEKGTTKPEGRTPKTNPNKNPVTIPLTVALTGSLRRTNTAKANAVPKHMVSTPVDMSPS